MPNCSSQALYKSTLPSAMCALLLPLARSVWLDLLILASFIAEGNLFVVFLCISLVIDEAVYTVLCLRAVFLSVNWLLWSFIHFSNEISSLYKKKKLFHFVVGALDFFHWVCVLSFMLTCSLWIYYVWIIIFIYVLLYEI